MTTDILYICENNRLFVTKTSIYIQNFKIACEKMQFFYG